MSRQNQRRALELPAQGAPSDWHLFRGHCEPAPGDVALCGYVLRGPCGHLNTTAGSTNDSGVPWCPLCVRLTAFLRDLLAV